MLAAVSDDNLILASSTMHFELNKLVEGELNSKVKHVSCGKCK